MSGPRAEAADRLYAAFSTVRRPKAVPGCAHCVGQDESSALCDVPLRALSEEDVDRYAFKAMTTWGDADDYRYFFPRLLELSDGGKSGHPGLAPWLMRSKLELAGWDQWSSEQRAAVEAYLDVTWLGIIQVDPERRSAAHALEELSYLKLDVQPWLSAWEGEGTLVAHRQLAWLVSSTWSSIASAGRPWSTSSTGQPPASFVRNNNSVAAWLRSPSRLAALEAGFERWPGEPQESEFAQAIDGLGWLKGT